MLMKKIFFLMCLLLSAALAFAQNNKKVAILEVVDREGRLSYSQKLILRSSMARAVSNTDGYEAYDRSDVDMIMSEQDFQRTGLVKDEEIQKLGEMTGVSLILVTEGVLTGENNIFVTAKILHVGTGKVIMMDNTMMKLSAEEMQKGCKELAAKLLGVSQKDNPYIITREHGTYLYKERELDRISYKELLETCPQAYNYYKQGKKLSTAGWVFMAIGPAMIAGGCVMVFSGNSYDGRTGTYDGIGNAGIALMSVGSASMTLISIPLLGVGYYKRNNAYKVYNNKCTSTHSGLSFNLTAGGNGIGLAMKF